MSENDPVIQLDRSLYKKIKTMDRLKMEEILQSVFNYGFKEALQLKNNVIIPLIHQNKRCYIGN